jgi:HAD superfamily hydrolase (TIGR01509 family)
MTCAALLDVDGTLVDDNLLHVLAWCRALRRAGHEIDATTVLHAIGMGGRRLVCSILGEDEGPRVVDDVDRMHTEAYLDAGLVRHAEALPGAVDLLAALRRRGVRTALASSARPDELERYLPLLGGPGSVDAVVTSEDVRETKPSPHVFAAALAKLGRPDRAFVVGDTVYDVAAARDLGLPCVSVLTGGIARRTLLEAGAAAVYEGPAEVAADLDRVLALAGGTDPGRRR